MVARETKKYMMSKWVATILLILLFCAPALGERGIVRTNDEGEKVRKGHAGDIFLFHRSHALVIGINEYDGLPHLTGAVRDAQNVAHNLEKRGIEVTTLFNEQATRDRITEILGDVFPGRMKSDDRVIVYFAGHGLSVGEKERAMGYLMPVDAHSQRVRSTGISMRELQAWFADYPCKHVMFVADACYSGLALSTRSAGLPRDIPGYLKKVVSSPVRISMTAGGANEQVHEWRGQGLFTHFFLHGIDGAADANRDGVVTSDELAAYVKPNVTQTAIDVFRAGQHPQIGRRGEGEFIFMVPGSMAGIARKANRDNSLEERRDRSDSPSGLPAFEYDRTKRAEGQERVHRLHVNSFVIPERGDPFLAWLAVKVERDFVEVFSNSGVRVTHGATVRRDSAAKVRTLKGMIMKGGDELTLAVDLLDGDGTIRASSEIAGSIDFFRRYRKGVAEALIYLMDVDKVSLNPLHSKNKATESAKAFLLYLKAREALLMKDSEKAVTLLKEAMAVDQGFAMASWSIGRIYLREGDGKNASVWLDRAAEMDPECPHWPLEAKTSQIASPIPSLMDKNRRTPFGKASKGLFFKVLDLDDYDVRVGVWKIDLSLFSVSIVSQDNPKGNSVRELAERHGGLLAVNGGFFELDRSYRLTPSGLLVIDGVVHSKITKKGGSGVVAISGSKADLFWSRNLKTPTEGFDFALQSGPFLVEKSGKMGIYSNNYNRLNRSAVGIGEDGKIVVIVVAGKRGIGLSLYELAEFLQTRENDGGLGCGAALNLDGGPSTQVFFRHEGREFEIEGLWRVNNALIVKRREP